MTGDEAGLARIHDWVGWVLLGVIGVVAIVAFNGGGGDEPSNQGGDDSQEVREGPPAPQRAPRIGMYVDSAISPTGDVEVSHWISSAKPIGVLALAAADPDAIPGEVLAREVVVVGEGIVLAREALVGTKRQLLELERPADHLYVAYRLTGGVDGQGTVADRGLAWSVALDVDYADESGSVVHHVTGPGSVLNVGCMHRGGDPRPRPCGRDDGDGWLVVRNGPNRDDRLLVQVDMR
jgi:hypothetical protein